MSYKYHVLKNGIRIIHREQKGNVSHCGLMVNTGSREELESESGMAHFIEHMIFKGTKKRKAYHVLSRIENAGGDLNAFTTKEETCIYASFLSSYYNQVLELFADVAYNSVFPLKEIVKEKDVIVDEINSYHDNPAEMIFDDFEDIVFQNHALGRNILGSIESVNRIKRNDIFRFVKRNYGTHQMVISSVGDIDFKKLIKAAEKYFGSIRSSNSRSTRNSYDDYEPKAVLENRDSYLTHAITGNLAYDRNHSKRLALAVVTNLLGGPALNSRLNLSVREKHGYAYTVEAMYQPYSDTGLFSVYVGSDKNYINKSLSLIHKELKKFRENSLGEIQLQRAKKQVIGQLAIGYESKLSEMLGIAKGHLYESSVKTIDDVIDEIDHITSRDILDVSNEIFLEKNMSTLIYNAREDHD